MQARCDACLQPNPEYTHYTKDFILEPLGGYPRYVDDGAWGVCAACHDAIVRNDKNLLFRRSVYGAIRVERLTAISWVYHLLEGFWKYRTGEWCEDTSTVIGEFRPPE